MSTRVPPAGSLPMLISNGAVLRFNQFSDRVGVRLVGGILFLMNTLFEPVYFNGMDRLAFFRNPTQGQVVLSRHERLENYRVIYWPRGYFLNLVDFMVNSTRGVVLMFDVLALDRPRSNDLVWAGLTASGQDIWCTDVILTGIDISKQIWMRHVPVQCFRNDVEACERWLFGMREEDEMVKET